MKPVDIVIVGAGDRGRTYAAYALEHPGKARIVGVAEPRDYYRTKMADEHEIPDEHVFEEWREAAKCNRFADAVVIATPDALHAGPAIAFANNGYHILLEKPMAPDLDSCRKITKAALDNKVILAVGHVLRYTKYTQKVKEIIDSGKIGNIVDIQRLEPLGYWHHAHSFVRGNWRREDESSFMLLAKSCHDLDWIRYIMGRECKSVSSFGSLMHFKRENKPENAGSRCTDCQYEPNCPYSAMKIYFGFLKRGLSGWPVSVVVPEPSEENLMAALREGPYGRCVYECDNDVVDHQIVNLEFEGGSTASFTMAPFTRERHRETRIFGTGGEIYGDGVTIQIHDFLNDTTETVDTSAGANVLEGHGGGDYWLIDSFVSAVAEKDPTRILSGALESLKSHVLVFAAEESRRSRRVVELSEYPILL
jgi:predicted dehydrogenase